MDLLLLIGVAASLLVLILTIWFFNKKNEKPAPAPQQRVPVRVEPGVPLRAQMARNQRNRARNVLNEQARNLYDRVEDVADDDGDEPLGPQFDEKIGTKKRAKLEAKAEKKAQRETELQLREEKKKREEKAQEERKKLEEQQEEEEKKREEAERLERELKEKQEHEEYLKMKEAFSVVEEGEEAEKESDNLLQEFVDFIKKSKVVVLEDLAREFNLKTQATIDRIKELRANGMLSGVIDDRGKFIYISEDELAAVAKFIRQRGRISITELAECSNNLINLQSIAT